MLISSGMFWTISLTWAANIDAGVIVCKESRVVTGRNCWKRKESWIKHPIILHMTKAYSDSVLCVYKSQSTSFHSF